MKNVVILGSTGSIGRSALDVISRNRDRFRVVGLTAHRNVELLARQVEEFGPEVTAVSDFVPTDALEAKKPQTRVLRGEEGVREVAAWEGADFVLSAIVGSAGLLPTLDAVEAGTTVGLANKETLVAAGDIVMRAAERSGSRILPVDSEHSAVFQCLEGQDRKALRRIHLTASGGPFVGRSREELGGVTPREALNHPSWSMGRKISVDSATLMNKGLEVIEAHHLFGVGPEGIEVLVHPQSIVHSMVEFADGSCIAQLSVPDMRGAIAYALSYPERLDGVIEPLDLPALGRLTFERPDFESFPCLSYAYEALAGGGTMPAVLNAANEVAVEGFLSGRVGFGGIPVIIKNTMNEHRREDLDGIEAVLKADSWARRRSEELLESFAASG
jgi:1-deoxy-D-xylulose-5-phosphate reductoisomerase